MKEGAPVQKVEVKKPVAEFTVFQALKVQQEVRKTIRTFGLKGGK
jgi:hypothetical protein